MMFRMSRKSRIELRTDDSGIKTKAPSVVLMCSTSNIDNIGQSFWTKLLAV